MPEISKPATREIVSDFAKDIRRAALATAKPSRTIINFRTDWHDKKERDIVRVPIELLRYRKDNGRIASDVQDYEKHVGILDECSTDSQELLEKFLDNKDPEKTAILRKTILQDGQREPAIVTADGFLINGNRRRLVLGKLLSEFPGNPSYTHLNCVILPGMNDEEPPPSVIEIEQVENRYQLQSDGKSEYYGFDRALSIQRKIRVGLSLEAQLRDDPRYAKATAREIKKIVKQYEKDYIEPLKCAVRYLQHCGKPGQYRAISTGVTDKEGRWQAFVDYSKTYTRHLEDAGGRSKIKVSEDEVGDIEAAAFSIIRLRVVPDMPKVHALMRELPKLCTNRESKKEILKLASEVEPALSADELTDEDGSPLSDKDSERKWKAKNQRKIIHRLHRARSIHSSQQERESTLELLDEAYKKLTHENLDLSTVPINQSRKLRDLIKKIAERAQELESEHYHHQKNVKKTIARHQ